MRAGLLALIFLSACASLGEPDSAPASMGDLTLLVALIKGSADPGVKPGRPVIESRINLFRKELAALSKKARDTRFVAVTAKKVPVWLGRPSRVRIGEEMEVDVTISPLREGKHPLQVIWYRVKDSRRAKIAASARTASLEPGGVLIPVMIRSKNGASLYVGVAIVPKEKK